MFERKSLVASEGIVRLTGGEGEIILVRHGVIAATGASGLALEVLDRLSEPRTSDELADELGADESEVTRELQYLFDRALVRYAGCAGEIPSLERLDEQTVGALSSHGVAVIREAIEPGLLDKLRAELEPLASKSLQTKTSVVVGKKRHSLPLPFEGATADPRVFCPGGLRHILPTLLGPRSQLYTCGLVMAEPDAPEQAPHRDDELDYGPALAEPFAIALAVPLEAHPEGHGNTAFRVGSHRQRASLFEPAGVRCGFTMPATGLGDVYLFDYRLEHRGSANLGPQRRNLVWFLYTRRWYADLRNAYQRPLAIAGHYFPDVALDQLLGAARWRHAWGLGSADTRTWADHPDRSREQS